MGVIMKSEAQINGKIRELEGKKDIITEDLLALEGAYGMINALKWVLSDDK